MLTPSQMRKLRAKLSGAVTDDVEEAAKKFYEVRRDKLSAPTQSSREWRDATDELMQDLGIEPYNEWLKHKE